MKVISVTPVGKKRYLEILVQYILKNRKYISEHHFWLDTKNNETREYVYNLARQYPDFFKINEKETVDSQTYHFSIWQYFQDYIEDDTIYLRLDEDICFIADDAIPNIIAYRIKNPKPFLVFGNIVNNSLCSYWHQKQGAIKYTRRKAVYNVLDVLAWRHPIFCEHVHRDFLADLKKGQLQKWYIADWALKDFERFSVNAFCWFGKDMKEVKELKVRDLRGLFLFNPHTHKAEDVTFEEDLLTIFLPLRFKRPNEVCGNALFCHFAYFIQRAYLEGATFLLEDYRDIAFNNQSPNKVRRKLLFVFKKMHFPISKMLIQEFIDLDLKPYLKKHFLGIYFIMKKIKIFFGKVNSKC